MRNRSTKKQYSRKWRAVKWENLATKVKRCIRATYLQRCCSPVLDPTNAQTLLQVWTENVNRKGAVNFITGAGGFLQAVLFGYGGFRIRADHLEFNPTLTPSSKKLTITGVDYLGHSMDFVIKKKRVMITLTTKKEIVAPKLEIVSNNKIHELTYNKTVSVMRGKGIIRLRQ